MSSAFFVLFKSVLEIGCTLHTGDNSINLFTQYAVSSVVLIAASENATNDPVTKNCRVRVKSRLEYTLNDKLTNTCFLIPGFPSFSEKDSGMFSRETASFAEVPLTGALGAQSGLVGIGLLRNRVQEK